MSIMPQTPHIYIYATFTSTYVPPYLLKFTETFSKSATKWNLDTSHSKLWHISVCFLLHVISYLQGPMANRSWFGRQRVQTLVLSKAQMRFQQSRFCQRSPSRLLSCAARPRVRHSHVSCDACGWDPVQSNGKRQTVALEPLTYGLRYNFFPRLTAAFPIGIS